MLSKSSIRGVSLDAAGLVALADLKTIACRTALTGSASFLDVLFLAPGIHCQQSASEVNGGEYPMTGAMTSGYVFRIENQATVYYLQRLGEPGYLVSLTVSPLRGSRTTFSAETILESALYFSGMALTIVVIVLLGTIHDWWGLGVLGMLMLARLMNIVVIKRRAQLGWKGAPEPGVKGDLLILLSQDRWVRMQGFVDDLKTVTSGQWLRELSTVESFAVSFATLLVYVSAALASNASTIGSLLLGCLLLISVALLGLSNSLKRSLRMFGRVVAMEGVPKKYGRRMDMVKELIRASGRDDWALGMGMIRPGDVDRTLENKRHSM